MDYLHQMAIEKVRVDFGDLTATVFCILIKKKFIELEELNFLIPGTNYNSIRTAIFCAHRHNIVDLRVNSENSNWNNENVKQTIKIFPNIMNSILRIRYSKLSSRLELEYGYIGGLVFEFLYMNGFSNIKEIEKNLEIKAKGSVQAENVIIQMARDGILRRQFNVIVKIKLNESKKSKNLNYSLSIKPVYGAKNTIWYIDLVTVDWNLSLSLFFSNIQEHFDIYQITLLKSLMTKLYSSHGKIIESECINLDVVNDYIADISQEQYFNENSIWLMLRIFSELNLLLNISKNFARIMISDIYIYIERILVLKFFNAKFGTELTNTFIHIESFRKGLFFQYFENEASIKRVRFRQAFFELFRLSFLKIHGINRSTKTNYKLNNGQIKIDNRMIVLKLYNETSKSILNLLMRLEFEISNFKRYSNKKKTKIDLANINIPDLQSFKIITLGISKLDTLLQHLHVIC